MKISKITMIYILSGGTAFLWAKLTHIGDVFLTINKDKGWGVHYGDLIGLIPLLSTTLIFFIKNINNSGEKYEKFKER